MHRLVNQLEDRTARIAVLGQGYVGLLVAMRASEAGFDVVGLEVDPQRAAALAAGHSYVEDVPDEVLAAALDRGYVATADPADLAGFDLAVITVPTPLSEGQPDVSHMEGAADMVAAHLRPGGLVVLESTTYPGTTEELLGPRIEAACGLRPGSGFLLGYSPERIDPGNGRFGLRNTPKVVSGVDADSLAAVEAFYGAFVEKLVPVNSPAEAELVKLLENTFRHVNIALVNELAVFANNLGVDIWSAIDAAATKPFGFMPFTPGPGVGGHCLPVDPSYLSWRVKRRLGETFRFVELANEVNEHMPKYVVQRVQELLNRDSLAVNGARVLVLGLAYKAGTSDARETPAMPVMDGLLDLGAQVTAIDPYVNRVTIDPRVQRAEFSAEALGAADVVIIVTDHPDFDYDLVAQRSKRVLDTRNRLRGWDAPHITRL
ncbi:MAG: nucleotide sugar dehydrogenase [Acidimicrobiia bacterium]